MRRRSREEFWFPKGPISARATSARWKRLRANYTDGELRARFKDYPGPLPDQHVGAETRLHVMFPCETSLTSGDSQGMA